MKEGDIAISAIIQADGRIKPRPVLLLKQANSYGDFIACGISSKINQEIKGLDLVINPKETRNSGLVTTSLVRLSFVQLLPLNTIEKIIGFVDDETLEMLKIRLADFIRK